MGYYDGIAYLNDFYKIDTTTFVVTRIVLDGDIIKKYSHSMVAIGHNIYIYGVYNAAISTIYLNDFYKIDTNNIISNYEGSSSVSVTTIVLGDAITGRIAHSMVAIGDNIYIFGGYNGSIYLNDFYKIDTNNIILDHEGSSNVSVEKIDLSGDAIIARRYHSMVAIGDNIYIYGGYNDDNYLNDFYKIDTTTYSVEKIENDVSTTIHRRSHHSMVAIGTDIYIWRICKC